MRVVILTACLIVAVYAQDNYSDDFGKDFNPSELLSNPRLLKAYTKCLLDKGPCTPEVKSVKDRLPEILATGCRKCSERQKSVGKKLAVELKKGQPTLWRELVKKYDPTGRHQESFKEFLTEQ